MQTSVEDIVEELLPQFQKTVFGDKSLRLDADSVNLWSDLRLAIAAFRGKDYLVEAAYDGHDETSVSARNVLEKGGGLAELGRVFGGTGLGTMFRAARGVEPAAVLKESTTSFWFLLIKLAGFCDYGPTISDTACSIISLNEMKKDVVSFSMSVFACLFGLFGDEEFKMHLGRVVDMVGHEPVHFHIDFWTGSIGLLIETLFPSLFVKLIHQTGMIDMAKHDRFGLESESVVACLRLCWAGCQIRSGEHLTKSEDLELFVMSPLFRHLVNYCFVGERQKILDFLSDCNEEFILKLVDVGVVKIWSFILKNREDDLLDFLNAWGEWKRRLETDSVSSIRTMRWMIYTAMQGKMNRLVFRLKKIVNRVLQQLELNHGFVDTIPSVVLDEWKDRSMKSFENIESTNGFETVVDSEDICYFLE